jgi:nicotinate-nucleotide adenylyltransferase
MNVTMISNHADKRELRVGLFGGTFDPPHWGHLMVAQTAWEELALDRLCFIPAALSPFKTAAPPTPPEQRLRLLRLALAGKPGWEIDDIELDRGGVSYTIDTVRVIAGRFAGARLFYLLGADHAALLTRWKQSGELARLVEFVLIPRPGHSLPELPPPFRCLPLGGIPMQVSASEIRSRIRKGRPIDHLVPPAVFECIRNNQLYL